MDPRTWLLKVAIVQIELKQKDPTIGLRSLPPFHHGHMLWYVYGSDVIAWGTRSNGGRLRRAYEIAALDAVTLVEVMRTVQKDDNLREVFARAARSIRQAFLHTDDSFQYAVRAPYFLLKHCLGEVPASATRSKREYVGASDSDSELAKFASTFRAFLASVLHLLTFVFQYLIGYVDRGGSKTYSASAFDFRASFVAVVLFQGAYVWIKFRQAARPGTRKRKAPDVVDIEGCSLKGLHKRSIKNASGDFVRFKYEPRFIPPRHEGDVDTELCSKRLPLGEYHTPVEAQIVRQIARYYYGKDGGCVELDDGRFKFPIPPMSEQERGFADDAKRTWVTRTAKQVGRQVYADFQREMEGKHLTMATEVGAPGAEFNDPSLSALSLPCSFFPVLTTMAAEPAIGSTAPSPSLPLLPFDGTSVGDADDSFEALSGFEDMFAELSYDPGLPKLPDRQSSVVSYQMHYQGFAQLPGDPGLPEVGAVPGGTEHNSEPDVNPSSSFQEQRGLAVEVTENIDGGVFLPQCVPDLQQLLLCQKKRLEENARQFVDLDHQLKAYQIQNSRLQKEKEQLQEEKEQIYDEKERLRTENEILRSRLEQVAKAQVATWTGIMIDIQQGT